MPAAAYDQRNRHNHNKTHCSTHFLGCLSTRPTVSLLVPAMAVPIFSSRFKQIQGWYNSFNKLLIK